MMAALPAFRLKIGYPAFTHTGVDYFGPIEVALFRRTMKRWGVIFTCLSTRGVHIEMAYSLDTSSYISPMDRFQTVAVFRHRIILTTVRTSSGLNAS